MPARQRLNAAYFQGSFLLAAMVGGACSSWIVFVIVLAALLLANWIAGDIRIDRRSP